MAQSNLVPTGSYPLAYDANAQPLALPPEAVKFYVKETTRGRPRVVYDKETGKQAELALTATLLDLRRLVPGPGQYRLQPVDANDRELTPVAHVELVPDGELESLSPPYMNTDGAPSRSDRMYEIVERLFAQRDAHDVMQADLLKTLITTTACIQQSTAQLLTAANTTIKIANGVEALERQQPTIDVEALGEQLSEMLAAQPAEKPEQPWFLQLLSSPLGAPIAQMMSGFMTTLAAAQAQATPRSATAPAPAPTAVPMPQPAAAAPAPQRPEPDASEQMDADEEGVEEEVEEEQAIEEETDMVSESCDSEAIDESPMPAGTRPEDASAGSISTPPAGDMQGSSRASRARQETQIWPHARHTAGRAKKAVKKPSRKHRRKRR